MDVETRVSIKLSPPVILVGEACLSSTGLGVAQANCHICQALLPHASEIAHQLSGRLIPASGIKFLGKCDF
jgi:hypothetical protein